MKVIILFCVLLAVTSCQLALYYQNHTRDSAIKVETSASADSSSIQVELPKIKSN